MKTKAFLITVMIVLSKANYFAQELLKNMLQIKMINLRQFFIPMTNRNTKFNIIRLFDPSRHKPKPKDVDPAFSEDICIIDQNGLHGLAFYYFTENKWIFYVDTLIDYNTEGKGLKWKWFYPPVSSEDIEW